jgi:hypothetical protein
MLINKYNMHVPYKSLEPYNSVAYYFVAYNAAIP